MRLAREAEVREIRAARAGGEGFLRRGWGKGLSLDHSVGSVGLHLGACRLLAKCGANQRSGPTTDNERDLEAVDVRLNLHGSGEAGPVPEGASPDAPSIKRRSECVSCRRGRRPRTSAERPPHPAGLTAAGYRHAAFRAFAVSSSLAPQNSHVPGVRAKGMTSRMLPTPVTNMSMRSNPSPKPACGTVP
jgi:hypothetical protein